jgi:hypothetical protein
MSNTCCLSFHLPSRLQPKNIKNKSYKTVILAVGFLACETFVTLKRDSKSRDILSNEVRSPQPRWENLVQSHITT